MTMAPVGGAGTLAIGVGAGVGAGVGVGGGVGGGVGVVLPDPEVGVVPDEPEEVPEDADDPDEVEDDDDPVELGVAAATAELVVLKDAVMGFGPEHPVIAKAARVNVPIAQKSFTFNCIGEPFRQWGAGSQAKLEEHLLWMYPVRVLGELQN